MAPAWRVISYGTPPATLCPATDAMLVVRLVSHAAARHRRLGLAGRPPGRVYPTSMRYVSDLMNKTRYVLDLMNQMPIGTSLKEWSLRWLGPASRRPHACMVKQLFFATGESPAMFSQFNAVAAPGCIMHVCHDGREGYRS